MCVSHPLGCENFKCTLTWFLGLKEGKHDYFVRAGSSDKDGFKPSPHSETTKPFKSSFENFLRLPETLNFLLP